MKTKLAVIAISAFLAACSSQPNKVEKQFTDASEISAWDTQGRVGIRTKDDAISGNFNWHHTNEAFELNIVGPFGQGSTELSKTKDGIVTLKNSDQTVTGDNAERLLFSQLGWRFPVAQVKYWIRGLPYPFSEARIENQPDNITLPKRIEQDGWEVSYNSYMDVNNLELPRKIQVSKPPYRVNLIITNWTVQ
ncbi:lipoprotein insertase outer membrane protein LolB [Marinomonas mediterranea]|jgi:outer membrane lipoprotein LolB|uniref:Outer-membrane lipoprotein LolB n=1 Tax=Marinomonas mediterranea (strain ATCC 700492 / JCM 21426 / NBRC 103028 / MMB-1) TaxID=717774 RepID=F2K0U5_MARM1|nr:lipoprotein insertase outer membrane protein LolB [Marinomonas mediterranea]ADZ92187.1 Outer-membrane lipoprotein lolB [Marinomonas mediterranea MMB-1]WCN10148.1 outer membrane lipoprotein LolB [Marinomonas mediterranea]WCN14193.1 outer membrane lipoprotein LolB [Marinomonas mediterranea]WCN18249.1 outer membrane lipoprotein LolB [Marinomonas mediterranea MMB-1]